MLDRIRGAFGPAELTFCAGVSALGIGIGSYSVPVALAVIGALLVAVAWVIR